MVFVSRRERLAAARASVAYKYICTIPIDGVLDQA